MIHKLPLSSDEVMEWLNSKKNLRKTLYYTIKTSKTTSTALDLTFAKAKIGTHYVHVSTAMLTKCVEEGMGRTYQK